MKRLVATITKENLERMVKDQLMEVRTPGGETILLRLHPEAKQLVDLVAARDQSEFEKIFGGFGR